MQHVPILLKNFASVDQANATMPVITLTVKQFKIVIHVRYSQLHDFSFNCH